MNASGNIVAKYEYSPFGRIVSASGSYVDANPFRFSSEYYDVETGLVYYNYRYYNVESGRWLSRDPIEEVGGINLYGFVDNNGVNAWDNLGLEDDPVQDFLRERGQDAKEAQKAADNLALDLWKGYIGGSLAALNSKIRSALDAIKRFLQREKDTPCNCKITKKPVGRQKNKLEPDANATGDHTTIKRDSDGNITGYETWTQNPRNPSGFDSVKRVDIAPGGPHYNKILDKDVPTPHVHGKDIPGGVRPADHCEIPK